MQLLGLYWGGAGAKILKPLAKTIVAHQLPDEPGASMMASRKMRMRPASRFMRFPSASNRSDRIRPCGAA